MTGSFVLPQVGSSTVTVGEDTTTLSPQDSYLVHADSIFSHTRQPGSVCLSVAMPWTNKERAFAAAPVKKK